MEHLGERLSALIDGELGAAEHERALIHLAKCEPCRFEADMMRRLKRRLTGLGEPEPDMDFMGRLLARPGSGGPWGSSDGGGFGAGDPPFGSSPPLGSSRPLGGFTGGGPMMSGGSEPGGSVEAAVDTEKTPRTGPGHARPGAEPRGRRGDSTRVSVFVQEDGVRRFSGGRYAVAGLAVATALLGSAFVAGGEPGENAPVIEPHLSDYAVEHAVTSRQVPVGEGEGWPAPVWPVSVPVPTIMDEHPSDPSESAR